MTSFRRHFETENPIQLVDAYLREVTNIPAEFHPDLIWNEGALGFWIGRPDKNKNNKNNKMSSNIRSVPGLKWIKQFPRIICFLCLINRCRCCWLVQALQTLQRVVNGRR